MKTMTWPNFEYHNYYYYYTRDLSLSLRIRAKIWIIYKVQQHVNYCVLITSILYNARVLSEFTMSDNGRLESGFIVVVVVDVTVAARRVTRDRNNGQRRIQRRMLMPLLLLLLLWWQRRWPGRALIRWTEMYHPGCRGKSRSSGKSTTAKGPRTSPACTRTTRDDTYLRTTRN